MRLEPKIVVRENVVNQSAREGVVKPSLIVIHSTEGSNVPGDIDLQGLANYFNNPAVDASSHVAVDADGHSARMVPDDRKAWTCAGFNSPSLNIEMIGKAAQTQWAEAEILEAARWVAHWSRKFDIPIREAQVSGSRIVRPGVIRHSQLGSYGGGHSDPGVGFPFGSLLHESKHIKTALQERDRREESRG